MRDSARWVQQWVSNRTLENFHADRQFQSSVIRELLVVGEAAYKVGKTTCEEHPSIEWSKVAAVRHILVHDYMAIDFDVVWKIATVYTPQLLAELDTA